MDGGKAWQKFGVTEFAETSFQGRASPWTCLVEAFAGCFQLHPYIYLRALMKLGEVLLLLHLTTVKSGGSTPNAMMLLYNLFVF